MQQEHHPPTTDSLDDIFGSSPPTTTITTTTNPEPDREPSDLPSLRRQHVTAGYRDGVSTSKTEHVQHGFDAGYPVGAQLGMRAGTILGILEGVLRGYEDRGSTSTSTRVGGVRRPQRGTGAGASTSAGGGNATTSDKNTEDKDEDEDKKARKEFREKVLRVYRIAAKELSVQGVFEGLEEQKTHTSFQGDHHSSDPSKEKGKEKPEDQLKRRGDKVISHWEEKVKVSHWEENMDALEEKGPDHHDEKEKVEKVVEQS